MNSTAKSQWDKWVVPPQVTSLADAAQAIAEALEGHGCRVTSTQDRSCLTVFLEDGRAVRVDLEMSEGRLGEPAPIVNGDDLPGDWWDDDSWSDDVWELGPGATDEECREAALELLAGPESSTDEWPTIQHILPDHLLGELGIARLGGGAPDPEPYEPTAEDLEDYARWSRRLDELEAMEEPARPECLWGYE